MKLILITTPYFFIEESEILTAFFDEGLDLLHIRKPETPAMYSERLLTLIPESYHRNIVIHDHFYLKEEFNLKGIHLNCRFSKEPEEYEGSLSCSCHSLEEVENKKHFYDYVLLSPDFNENPYQDFHLGLKEAELLKAKDQKIIDSKVYALGGVNENNIKEIKHLGYGGVAIQKDIWGRFNPKTDRDFKEVINHFKRLKKLAD